MYFEDRVLEARREYVDSLQEILIEKLNDVISSQLNDWIKELGSDELEELCEEIMNSSVLVSIKLIECHSYGRKEISHLEIPVEN